MNNNKQDTQLNNIDGLIDAREASRRLGLSFWTLYTWTRAGKIPFVQLGKRKLFDPKDILDFIKQHRVALKDEREGNDKR